MDAWGNPIADKVNDRVKVTSSNYIKDICQPASVFGKIGTRVSAGFARCDVNGHYYCNNKCADVCGSCTVADPRQNDAPPYFHLATRPVGGEAFQNLGNNPSDPDPLKNLFVFKRDYKDGAVDEQVIENSVLAMIVSFGKNGEATWKSCATTNDLTAVEVENCNQSQKFMIDLPAEKDEYFSWMTLYRAKQIMIERGGFPSE